MDPSSALCRNWKHHVFINFHGADVRRKFLSHILKEFKRKGIDPFIDNDIEKSKPISFELIEAIRGSSIAIVLLSTNYASSTWCLDELVEIMKCREDFGQIVIPIFYDMKPSDINMHTGSFQKVFTETCIGKTKEVTERWRQVLVEVGKIAGYHSCKWDNEAAMIGEIADDISNKLNTLTPSSDFDEFVGMDAYMEKMEPLLRLDSKEVRMIGVWGPPGIGKTTIARFLFNQLSKRFDLSVFMDNIKARLQNKDGSDDYCAKLQLQQQLMSKITNQEDIKVNHLGVVEQRLKNKKVLVVLDDVDQLVQLHAMAKEAGWFGRGSRIIITTQYQNLFRAHGINHIYRVDFPSTNEALQIFCMYAFGQKFPKEGFEEIAWEIAYHTRLPLGLKLMGSYFRGMSKQEWINALPMLETHLDGRIESILKLCFDALCDEEKTLFLYIACFFNYKRADKVEEHLSNKFKDVRQGLHGLVEKSLITIELNYINSNYICMDSLLSQLGRDIVRKQNPREPGKRQFLDDARDIFTVLSDDAVMAENKSVIGIQVNLSGYNDLDISEGAFQRVSNLQFLRLWGYLVHSDRLYLPKSLNYQFKNLRIFEWSQFPMTCLPSNFNPEFLVELDMSSSNLVKLWEGTQPSLQNLKWMNLGYSVKLMELPDLTTAINLKELNLQGCLSLEKLPSSIKNATNLQKLDLSHCSSLVELPFSIGSLHKLPKLSLEGCSKLKVLPTNINMESLNELDLTDCSVLKSFPEISTNIQVLKLSGTAIEEAPLSIRAWPRLDDLHMSYCENLQKSPHALDRITMLYIKNTEIKEVSAWVKNSSCLRRVIFNEWRQLSLLPPLPDFLSFFYARVCESMEGVECSFYHSEIHIYYTNCSDLNKRATDAIISASACRHALLLNGAVPAYFTYRANGDSVTVKLDERPLPTPMRFIACILLAKKSFDASGVEEWADVTCTIIDKQTGLAAPYSEIKNLLVLTEHLFTFDVRRKVSSSELLFEFKVDGEKWEIRECGVDEHVDVLHFDE